MFSKFQWHADADQTYTVDNGSQTSTMKPSDFNKNPGKSFDMDAMNCVLGLLAIPSSGALSWPAYSDNANLNDYADISIENGTLISTGSSSFLCGGYIQTCGIKLTVFGTGNLLIAADTITLNNYQINSPDQLRILVSGNGTINFSSPEINLYSGNIDVEGNGAINFTTTKFNGPILDSNVTLSTISPRITLGGGNPAVYFTALNAGDTPVDAMPATGRVYAADIFTFQAGSQGKFVFENVGNAFELSALLAQNAISIDGKNDPTYIRSKLNPNTFINGDLVLQLK